MKKQKKPTPSKIVVHPYYIASFAVVVLAAGFIVSKSYVANASQRSTCNKISDGVIKRADGSIIENGTNADGNNYQAHKYDHDYCKEDYNSTDCKKFKLSLRWNDAYLSNMDCDNDLRLDHHYGYDTYKGSGAWLERKQDGTTIGDDGKEYMWSRTMKIEAVPQDAVIVAGDWQTADGKIIGAAFSDEFALVQDKFHTNDPSGKGKDNNLSEQLKVQE